ncbi:MAG: hypothetical protein FJ247_07415 [Nitrospira sp.]|nr:hypothetical protein [Nitrospira sp.]
MAKKAPKRSAESEETRLKKRVAERRAAGKTSEGTAAFRALRKRLKREQRKRRALALRKKHAAGGKAAAAPAST